MWHFYSDLLLLPPTYLSLKKLNRNRATAAVKAKSAFWEEMRARSSERERKSLLLLAHRDDILRYRVIRSLVTNIDKREGFVHYFFQFIETECLEALL